MLPSRQCQVLRLIRRHGPMSRSNLSHSLPLHPNIAGQLVGGMIEAGILREGISDPFGRGRPRVPLEIDPGNRFMLAATINREEVSACRFNLLGQAIGNTLSKSIRQSSHPARVAADLLTRLDSEATLGVGVSVNGFINPDDPRTLLLSSVASDGGSADLSPLYDFVGERPMVLENDMHALAAQWVLSHARDASEHILLVSVRDGSFGAAILADGRPSHCGVAGCNELGHVRFLVDTDLCHCGRKGCLERICSSGFLRLKGASDTTTLLESCAKYHVSRGAPMTELLRYLSIGLANAVNFVRPDRLVIASPFVKYPAFADRLQHDVREQLLKPIADRLHIDLWPPTEDQPSVKSLGWLVLAPIYIENWPLHNRKGMQSTSSVDFAPIPAL
jgi:N-acetylglucosamine repressor